MSERLNADWVRCPTCDAVYDDEATMRAHTRRLHPELIADYERACPCCLARAGAIRLDPALRRAKDIDWELALASGRERILKLCLQVRQDDGPGPISEADSG